MSYGFIGSVSGTLRYPSGKPVVGREVYARFVNHSTGATGEGTAITDVFGNYSIRGLTHRQLGEKTEFSIAVANHGESLLSRVPAIPVTLTPAKPRVDGVDFVMEPGPEITVRVHDAETGAPIAGMSVAANRGEFWSVEPAGVTDANGQFVYHSPNRQNDLVLDQEHQGNPANSAAPGYSFYYRQTLTPGAKTVWDVRTYAAPLDHPMRTFRGTISDRNGEPLRATTVHLLRDQFCRKRDQQTRTDENGVFTFLTERVDQFSDNSGAVLLVGEGVTTMVRFVHAADLWQPLAIVFNPTPTATVSGRVVAPGGSPLAGVPVSYDETFWNPEPNTGSGSSNECFSSGGAPVTDAAGRFAICGLHPEAVYRFTFGGVNQGGNQKAFGISLYPPPPRYTMADLRLKPGEGCDIGDIVVWEADKTISGRLVDERGDPVSNDVMLAVSGDHTKQSVTLKPDGTFHVVGLVAEPLYLMIVYGRDGSYGWTEEKMRFPYRRAVRAGDTNLRIVAPPRNAP